ncbi:carboxymuconolactone decarboxylase family protein [Acinetobacter proteolyticus]|uniref:Carboxymuconolactone decarboxylase family protein n=1 Tax=Acinetobacter proteolyticus TaxID=1776741 RepID=A0A2N0WJH1_9GAMM|nr:carboxymuconolactone decarboxylase family protein [Acinetobacter proteolyticus]PKF36309.1 carboxymuconolactone decarboxylase family protein [Acinetobacter proteolyticus]
MDYKDLAKKTIQHLYSAHASIRASGIDPSLIALAELYVSQINGCAYCCAYHAQELRDMGVEQTLIDKIPGYKHSNAFSEKQKLVLEWAEATTTLSDKVEYIKAQLAEHFNEREIVELSSSIALMGALNRLRMALGEKV